MLSVPPVSEDRKIEIGKKRSVLKNGQSDANKSIFWPSRTYGFLPVVFSPHTHCLCREEKETAMRSSTEENKRVSMF